MADMKGHHLQRKLLAALNGNESTAAALAAAISVPVTKVEAELEALVRAGSLTREAGTDGAPHYRAGPPPVPEGSSVKEAAPRRTMLGDMLVQAGLITGEQLTAALAEQASTGLRLGQILVQRGYISKQTLGKFLEAQRGVPYADLTAYPIDRQLMQSVPDWIVTQYRVVPLARHGEEIHLAMLDPTDVVAMDTAGRALGGRIRPLLMTETDFDWALTTFFGLGKKVGASLQDVPPDDLAVQEETPVVVAEVAEDAPIVRVFNSILDQAIRAGATDVHIEPDTDAAHVRFRVDGILFEKASLPQSVAAAVVSRLKVLATMDIGERLRPQDGRILVQHDGQEYDLRVATVGTVFGERAAIRLLSKRQVQLGLERLGLSPEEMARLQRLLIRPYGMVLITGPTGSGKTTTLYAATAYLNERTRNIITIEDPVEYRLPGITQILVREKAGITFDIGLRGILRQDPDVVVVGEIRDPQTASTAGQAALTGHLVLTTLHTSSAAGALVRLLDLGLEPFLITSSVLAVVGQRLLRMLCPACRRPRTPGADEPRLLGFPSDWHPPLFAASGCAECNQLGYKGRTGVFEIIEMTDAVRQAVLDRRPASAVAEAARAAGTVSLRDAAVRKVLEGVTSVEEFRRVILPEGS